MIEVYDKNGNAIQLENYRSDVEISNNSRVTALIVNRVAIITFEALDIKVNKQGDLFTIPILDKYTIKKRVHFSMLTNSKTPVPIMSWVEGKNLMGYAITPTMQVIGTVVVELA